MTFDLIKSDASTSDSLILFRSSTTSTLTLLQWKIWIATATTVKALHNVAEQKYGYSPIYWALLTSYHSHAPEPIESITN